MKVTNLNQVKALLALSIGMNPLVKPFLVTDVSAGPDHNGEGKAQPHLTIQAGPAFFLLSIDEPAWDVKPGNLIMVDLESGEITHAGDVEVSDANKALIQQGSSGKAAKEVQTKGATKSSGRTCSERVRNEL